MKSKVLLAAMVASMAICSSSYATDGLLGRMLGRGGCGCQAASCCDTPTHANYGNSECCDLLDVGFRLRIGYPRLGGGGGGGHCHDNCGYGGDHHGCGSGGRGFGLLRGFGHGSGCGCGQSYRGHGHDHCGGCDDYGCGYRRPSFCLPRFGFLDKLRCIGSCFQKQDCCGHDYGCDGCSGGNYSDCGCSHGYFGWGGLRNRGWGHAGGYGCGHGCDCGCGGGHSAPGHQHNHPQQDVPQDAAPLETAPSEAATDSTTYRITPAPNVDPSAFVIPNRRNATGR